METYGFVIHKAQAILRNEDDAAEVAQEVYLRAHANWRKLERHPSRVGWLLTTTGRLAIDRLRRAKVAAERAPSPLPATPGPAGRIEAAEILDGVLSVASERTRQIVLHVYLDGMTQEETAEILQISRKTVQRHLERFKARCAPFAEVYDA
jgi:RNA polymerase sigma-70 factor (ECF subfamily)